MLNAMERMGPTGLHDARERGLLDGVVVDKSN